MMLKGLWPHVPSRGRNSGSAWCCDSSFNCLTGHSILSASIRFKWAIPGTVIHSGACVGSWFFARKPGSGNRDTTSCRCVFPLRNTHLPGATLNACRYDSRLAEANANRNTHFMVCHFRGMTSSEDSPSSSPVSAKITTQDEGPT